VASEALGAPGSILLCLAGPFVIRAGGDRA
jgi:hypothetical protein